jgi:hypothetical protein
MQPTGSSVVSQVLPLPVLSFRLPGANVPDFSASCALPPIEAICLASARVMALLTAAALVDAGSYRAEETGHKNMMYRFSNTFGFIAQGYRD